MANRYRYQFAGDFKPDMGKIEGFVSIGTGGLLNFPDAYPVFPVATGATGGVAGSLQTGAPRFLQMGQSTAGVPTGWQGGFSGAIDLLGLGVKGIQRVSTGTYAIQLEDDWVSLDHADISPFLGATGTTGLQSKVLYHTIGQGNTVTTGGLTLPQFNVMNPKNVLWIQFDNGAGVPADVPGGGGFSIGLLLKDSTAVQ